MSMVEVYRGSNYLDAQLVRGLLDSHGFEVHMQGEWLQGGVGELAPHDLFRIKVPERQSEAALDVIKDYESAELPEGWEDQAEGQVSA